jgi:hypothetical protein
MVAGRDGRKRDREQRARAGEPPHATTHKPINPLSETYALVDTFAIDFNYLVLDAHCTNVVCWDGRDHPLSPRRRTAPGAQQEQLMTITIGQSFVFELLPLFIRIGSFELFWSREGFVICKGMETVMRW